MLNHDLKDAVVSRILPNVRTPAQYVGGELNSIVKDHRTRAGNRLPGFSRHLRPGDEPPRAPGPLQPDERRTAGPASASSRRCPTSRPPSREHGLPLYSLETFTPLNQFDVLGFSLQYEICYTNVLTMLDLGGIALHAEDRGPDDTLVIAGGPGGQNPELLAPFIDLFVIGDGEPSLPVVCDLWKSMKGSGLSRADKLARIAGSVDMGLCARGSTSRSTARTARSSRSAGLRDDVPEAIKPVRDPRPGRHPAADPADRSRSSRRRTTGSPSRSCAAAPGSAGSARARSSSGRSAIAPSRRSSRPRSRAISTTGYDEISLLSLSTSDYPDFEELVTRMSEVFTPLGVKISLPSLRITETLKKIPALLAGGAAERPDAGPRGRARRHARADPQADQQPGPL